jgi:hypothetical protein
MGFIGWIQLNSFLQKLQKRAVEKMLEGELDRHLGCEKHQIRNACRYVVWKDRKAFTRDMKGIYTALPRMLHGPHSTILPGNGIPNTHMPSKAVGTTGMS